MKIEQPDSPASQPDAEAWMTFSSDLKELSGLRQFIRNFCRTIPEAQLGEARISMIELAVTEVATNIIRHAYGGKSDALVQVVARRFPDMFLIEFIDKGKGFSPEKVQHPQFDGSREGGFGVYIVSQIMDDVVYSRGKDNTNRTRLKILLKLPC